MWCLSLQIVDHRVDRMYFMSGNSIKLKPRYDVDDDELMRMKEMQAKNKETAYKRSDICLIKINVFCIVIDFNFFIYLFI